MSLRDRLLSWCDEQLAMCERATPGEWRLNDRLSASENGQGWRINAWRGRYGAWIADVSPVIKRYCGDASAEGRANAELLSASRTLLPLVLRALRQEVEAHMWSNPNLPEGLGDRYYRCVGCDETWPLVEPCPTILRIAQALGVSRWQE